MKRTESNLKSRNYSRMSRNGSQKSYGTASYSTQVSSQKDSFYQNYGFENKITLIDKAALVKGMTGDESHHLVIGQQDLASLYWKFQKNYKNINDMIEMLEGVLKKETRMKTDLFVLQGNMKVSVNYEADGKTIVNSEKYVDIEKLDVCLKERKCFKK
jgi:hypothetical protein